MPSGPEKQHLKLKEIRQEGLEETANGSPK